MSSSINTDAVDFIAENAVTELISVVFSNIAYMDPETVRSNMELASEYGMSKSDRSIKVDLANYLLSHFSLIYTGLIVNSDFRDTVVEAVAVEIALDSKPAGFVQQIRSDMQNNKSLVSDRKGIYVINLGRYNDSVYKKINAKLFDSFDKVKKFDKAIDYATDNLEDDAKIRIGFCVSNFMYLIRAFSKNPLFTRYVKTIIHSVQHQLGLSV